MFCSTCSCFCCFVLYFVLLSFFISSAVAPDDISVFQKRYNESSVYNFQNFSVQIEFNSSHYINSSPCFVCYEFYMFMQLIR